MDGVGWMVIIGRGSLRPLSVLISIVEVTFSDSLSDKYKTNNPKRTAISSVLQKETRKNRKCKHVAVAELSTII